MKRSWRRPPRIALFTDTFDEVSGVGHTFKRLAEHCRRHDLSLDIFTVSPTRSSCEQDGSVTVHRLKPRVPVSYSPGLYLDLVPIDDTVLSIAAEHRFDVIHVATPGHMGVTALYVAARMGLPVLGSYHTELPQYVSQRLLAQIGANVSDDPEAAEYVAQVSSTLTWDFLSCFYNHCAKVLVPSRATREQVARHLRVPLELFPRGVDTETFSPAYRRRGDDGRVRVLYVGRLAIEKNLGWLVAFGRRHPELELVLVGDGPQRGELEAALPDAVFTGFLEGEALQEAYASADIFAFPSQTDTFGNVVLEALASGLPVVVSDQGGPPEIVGDSAGGLIAGDYDTFEAHLLGLAHNAERRAAMSAAARARACEWSWDEVFERLFAEYRRVRYPWRRRLWLRALRRLRESDSPAVVGLIAFWKQFGRRRAARAAARRPLDTRRLSRRPSWLAQLPEPPQ